MTAVYLSTTILIYFSRRKSGILWVFGGAKRAKLTHLLDSFRGAGVCPKPALVKIASPKNSDRKFLAKVSNQKTQLKIF